MTDQGLQSEVLEDLSSAVNYRRWICGLADPWLGDDAIEFGSGTGDYVEELRRPGRRLTASEAENQRVQGLRQRFRDAEDVTSEQLRLPTDRTGQHSAAFAFNVLEHVPDDVEALRSMARNVAPGGHVVIFVPAFPIGMSDFDRAVGHVRRYRRATLRRAVEAAGMEVVELHHVNAPGLVAWIVLMRLLRGRPREGLPLRVFERFVPTLSRMEQRRRPPFGQSLFAVGRTASTTGHEA